MALRVHWKLGDFEVEVEGDDEFIEKQLKLFLERVEPGLHPVPPADLPSKIVAAAKSTTAPAPAEYYRQKKPQGGTETLLVLAKYLNDYRSQNQFTKNQITKLANEAKIKDVHGQYFTLAVKQGLLRTAGKGNYALTISGEDAVAAMPTTRKG
jgi:hypothetical protein